MRSGLRRRDAPGGRRTRWGTRVTEVVMATLFWGTAPIVGGGFLMGGAGLMGHTLGLSVGRPATTLHTHRPAVGGEGGGVCVCRCGGHADNSEAYVCFRLFRGTQVHYLCTVCCLFKLLNSGGGGVDDTTHHPVKRSKKRPHLKNYTVKRLSLHYNLNVFSHN